MPQRDPARIIKDGLASWWAAGGYPADNLTLNVDDDFQPTVAAPTLLVAGDGGPNLHGIGAWLLRNDAKRITIRLTAFATGRTQACALVGAAADELCDNRPAGIARIEDVSAPLVTKDRATEAWLASILVPVIVKPVTA